jgi:hypothetical protein
MSMKCPHCNQTVGVFSKALNRFGRNKTCPHCGGAIRLHFDVKTGAVWFVVALFLAFLLRPFLGSWSTAPGIILVLYMATRLRPVDVKR